MLDIKFVRNNPEVVKQNIKNNKTVDTGRLLGSINTKLAKVSTNATAEVGTNAAAQMAAATGVPQSTWESIIARESNGDHTAANGSGASGLFQTMPGWGSTATVEDQIQSALNAYNAQGLSAWNY